MFDSLAKFLSAIIRVYQLVISPLLPARCRFYPTCSNYGIEAIQQHGGVRGGVLILRRIGRCHPWGGSGIDFVPLALYRYQYKLVKSSELSKLGFGVLRVSRII